VKIVFLRELLYLLITSTSTTTTSTTAAAATNDSNIVTVGHWLLPTGFTRRFCKKALGRTARHRALNDLVACSFVSAGIPITKEPSGIS